MGDKKITIDGEEYISSARAAELVGYTKDYVGQLARYGKIKAKRVGRNWYIEEASINKHKLSVHYTLTKPKKSRRNDIKDEKPTINIVKSVSPDTDDVEEGTPSKTITSAEPVSSKHENIVEDIQENADDTFLPRIRKSERDALLHTDIRYERPKQPEYTRPNNTSTGSNFDDFQTVPMRKPTLGGIVRKKAFQGDAHNFQPKRDLSSRTIQNRHDGKGVAVDGIVIQNRQKVQRTEYDESKSYTDIQPTAQRREKRHNVHNTIHTNTIEFEEYHQRGQKKHKNEISKTIPVIGAIVIFTVVVVVYILFFSSN